MTDRPEPRLRPGGRTAKTKVAVFEAVTMLVAEKGYAAVSMTDIAERAGVAATSLYRRWGDVSVLVTEVAVEQLIRDHPLPDTGSLAGDLRTWGRSIAAGLKRPGGSSFFRAIVSTSAPAGDAGGAARIAALAPRQEQIVKMLERARTRGEQPPSVAEVLDHLLAPLYVRALFGTPANETLADRLVERLLRDRRES